MVFAEIIFNSSIFTETNYDGITCNGCCWVCIKSCKLNCKLISCDLVDYFEDAWWKKLLKTMSILQKGWLYLLIQGIFIRHKSGHIDIRNWFSLLNSNFNIITQNRSLGTRGEIALWRIPQNLTDEKSTSAQLIITMTSQWARWRLKSPASRLFTQPFIRAQIKVDIKAPRHWPCVGYSPHKWPVTRKMFHLMTSSWMAWCRQAKSYYLSHCRPRSISPYGVIRPELDNSW